MGGLSAELCQSEPLASSLLALHSPRLRVDRASSALAGPQVASCIWHGQGFAGCAIDRGLWVV